MGKDCAKYKLVIIDLDDSVYCDEECEDGDRNDLNKNYLEILIWKCIDIPKRDNDLGNEYELYTDEEEIKEIFPFFDFEKYKEKYKDINWALKEIWGIY